MIHVLDVGANIGSFGLELARRNPQASVHLIEPEPDIAEELRHECAAAGLSNAFVHEVALGTTDGDAELYVSTLGDRGTTSMLPFDNRKIASNSYWSHRIDLRHEATVRVPTFRLRTFMEKHGIKRIDFIKIDAQGLDLEVLASAEDYIGAIHAGMLEVPTTEMNALYIGERQNLCMALNFLEENGFKIVAVKPNDPACNEVNVFFSREPDTWEADTIAWGLRGLPAFDGKHYWHAPSSSPLYANDVERELRAENQRLLVRIVEQDAEIGRSAARIVEQDAEIGRSAARIVEQDAEIGRSAARIVEQDAEIGRSTARIVEQDAEIGRSAARIVEQDAEIGRSAARIVEQDAEIGRSTARIVEQDAEIGRSTARIVEQDAEIGRSAARIVEQDAEIGRSAARIVEQKIIT